MADYPRLSKRVEKYKASKTVVFWACAACVVATIVVGFTWGGWVTGKTAREMASNAAAGGRAELAATFCVHQFTISPDATVQLAALTKLDGWNRGSFVEKGGWARLPGMKTVVPGAADLCANELIHSKLPPESPASISH